MNKFEQWVCSRAFYDLAQNYRVASIANQGNVVEAFERLAEGIIAAEQQCREAAGAEVGAAMPGLSKYTPAIVQFQRATGGDVYCFVVDGNLGTGGMPLLGGFPRSPEEYRQRCEALIELLRRSAELLAQDVARRAPNVPEAGAGGVG